MKIYVRRQPLSLSHNSFNSFPRHIRDLDELCHKGGERERIFIAPRRIPRAGTRIDFAGTKYQWKIKIIRVFCLVGWLAWLAGGDDGPKIVFIFIQFFFCCVLELCVSQTQSTLESGFYAHLISTVISVVGWQWWYYTNIRERERTIALSLGTTVTAVTSSGRTKYDQLMDIFIASIYFLCAHRASDDARALLLSLDICLSRDTFFWLCFSSFFSFV